MDNLQTKTEKLIKYGNEKFGLNETSLRGILDNASAGGGGGEADPNINPTWWDIKSILENDTRDYTYKTIWLLRAPLISEGTQGGKTIRFGFTGAFATSDGAFYESNTTHTWDETKDKPCFVDGKVAYKTRYIIGYSNTTKFFNIPTDAWNDLGLLYIYTSENNRTVNMINQGFYGKRSGRFLERTVPMAIEEGTQANQCFSSSRGLKDVSGWDFSKATNVYGIFDGCCSLKEVNANFKSATNCSYAFNNCYNIERVYNFGGDNSTTFKNAFTNCYKLQKVDGMVTKNGQDFYGCFDNDPYIEYISAIDLRSATNVSNIFNSCYSLKKLDIRNIPKSLMIGSSSWGKLLSLESLINTVKELWDKSDDTSTTYTLTMGSANLTKIANVYVKLIDITDEMRAEDEYIDIKLPCEVCESTDEGAMLLTNYATLKGWTIA